MLPSKFSTCQWWLIISLNEQNTIEGNSVAVNRRCNSAAMSMACQLLWLHLRLLHTYHAVPTPRPCPLSCRAAKGLDCIFPIRSTQCGRVWFTHAMLRPCHTMPRPCRSERNLSRPRHSATWAWHVWISYDRPTRHVGNLPAFGFFRLLRGVPRRLSEAYQSVKL
jgi:hypothetical protein